MKRWLLTIGLALPCWAVDFVYFSAVSFRDARFGCDVRAIDYFSGQPGLIDVEIPPGEWNALTFTMWLRLTNTNALQDLYQQQITTGMMFCPEPIQRAAPDLLCGACGFPSGTNVSGAASFALSFSHEGGTCPTNVFARGVYTVAGWASNAVVVIVGGNEITVGPGAFNRNVEPGPSDGVIVDGTGALAVGVSRLHAHQWFGFVDGVREGELLSRASVITNELVFVSFRLECRAAAVFHRTDLWHIDDLTSIGVDGLDDLPKDPSRRSFSSLGLYRVGMQGFCANSGSRMDVFDYRCFTRLLTDAELLRVFDNGRLEIERRGIPRWRNGY